MIYFVKPVGADGPVKIGYTGGDPLVRLRMLQTGSPAKLEVMWSCEGKFEDEQALHFYMRAERMHGEWFRWCDRLRDLIKDLRSGWIDWDTLNAEQPPSPYCPAWAGKFGRQNAERRMHNFANRSAFAQKWHGLKSR